MAFDITSWKQGGRDFARGRSPAQATAVDPRSKKIGKSIMLASGTVLGLVMIVALRDHSKKRYG